MKIRWHEIYDIDRSRIPRKIKKRIFGYSMSKKHLRKLLDSVELGESRRTIYDEIKIKPYPFCPHCGSIHCTGGGNRAEYPDHWEYFYCVKCWAIVGYIDNSPFIHALECKDNNYNPVF